MEGQGFTDTDREALDIYKDIIDNELSQDVIDYGSQPGLRALHVVSRAGDLELINALLKRKADVNFCTSKGLTPLHYAVLSDSPDVVRLLYMYGANINAASKRDGKTALHTAVEKIMPNIVTALLETGADVNALDFNAKTPRQLAEDNFQFEILELIERFEQHGCVQSRKEQQAFFQHLGIDVDPFAAIGVLPLPLFELCRPHIRENDDEEQADADIANLSEEQDIDRIFEEYRSTVQPLPATQESIVRPQSLARVRHSPFSIVSRTMPGFSHYQPLQSISEQSVGLPEGSEEILDSQPICRTTSPVPRYGACDQHPTAVLNQTFNEEDPPPAYSPNDRPPSYAEVMMMSSPQPATTRLSDTAALLDDDFE